MDINLLNKLRKKNPLAYNICNFVTVQDVCNAINAIGASPIAGSQTEDVKESEDLIKSCDSFTVNIGTLTESKSNNINSFVSLANKYHKPVILDPVAVGASNSRKKRTQTLLKHNKITVIRGNAGEIAALAGIKWSAKGIDVGKGSADTIKTAKDLAKKYNCVVVESGKVDIITNGEKVSKVFNGTKLFKLHVGSGDMLSSIIGCFCGIENNYFNAAGTATLIFSVVGEIAANLIEKSLPSIFNLKFIDELYSVNTQQIKNYAKFA